MTMQRDIFEELCSAYVLGALSTEETLEFERELVVCDSESRRFFDGVAYAALHLPLGVELVAPPSHVKVKILQAILPQPEPEPTLWQRIVTNLGLDRPALAWTAAFLFLFGVLGSSIYSFKAARQLSSKELRNQMLSATISQRDKTISSLTHTKEQLTHALTDTKRQLQQARMTIAKQSDLLEVLRGRQVQLVSLGATSRHAKGFGKVIWDPIGRKAVIQVANLPTPTHRDYQLWWIIKKRGKLKPIPAGTFSIAQAGPETFFNIKREFLPKLSKKQRASGIFAITIEKEGGVDAPTMKPLILGNARVKIQL